MGTLSAQHAAELVRGAVHAVGCARRSMFPYLGQGANIAIDDGYVLARCVDAFEHDIPEALRLYEQLRVPRTTNVVNESATNLKRFRLPAVRDSAHTSKYISNAWKEQMSGRDWIFSYDAAGVSLAEAQQAHA